MEAQILIAGRTEQIQNYKCAVERAGGRGIGLFECAWEEAVSADGLLLPGGGDILPELFGQTNEGSRQIDEALDRLQLRLTELYCRQRKPILGICKGIQILNVYFGGTILQELPTAFTHEYPNGDQRHMTIARQSSVLCRLYGLRFPVNSAHHQGIDRLGTGLEAIQFAEDQVVEGIAHTGLPILGVQWHPERMLGETGDCRHGERLFQYWLAKMVNS